MAISKVHFVEIVILINQKNTMKGQVRQPCVKCGTTQKITDLWEPRWQWDMEGYYVKNVLMKKKKILLKRKIFVALCETKMGLIRHNPKGHWKIEGQLCGKCWDEKKAEFG